MILKTFVSSLFGSLQGQDLLNTDVNDLQEARAFLFPISQSAIYSCSLIEETSLVFSRSFNRLSSYDRSPLLSPKDTEDEDNEPTKHERMTPLLLLQQTYDDEKFTFGSSPQSDIVLKRSKSEPETCWINLQHCVLYPHPDNTSITLHNPSKCEFRIQRLEAKDKFQVVKPSSRLVIHEGAWHLNLGKGFDFQINVLQHSKEWSDVHNALITAMEISAKPLYATKEERVPVGIQLQIQPGKAIDQTTKAPDKSIAILQRDKSEKLDANNVETSSASQETELPAPTASSSRAGKYRRMSLQSTPLGETRTSRVVKRTAADGTVRAVKICRHPDNIIAAKSWQAEAKILKLLNHASIVRLFEFDATHLSLELEFVPGGSLDKLRDEQSMCTIKLNALQPIWLDICKGLEYIHARGIIHCDVKPGNILLKFGGEGAVLCDFGHAVTSPSVKDRGTPCYIPPEGLYGEWSFSGDIWGLGVALLYAARLIPLPNRSWIIANIQTDVDAAHEMGDWLLNITKAVEKIPKRLHLLRKMLENHPRNRISARELVKDLEHGSWLKGSRSMKILQ